MTACRRATEVNCYLRSERMKMGTKEVSKYSYSVIYVVMQEKLYEDSCKVSQLVSNSGVILRSPKTPR